MGGKKLTELLNDNPVTSLSDEDLIYVVDKSASIGLKSGAITKSQLKETLGISNTNTRLVSGGMVWVSGLTYESVDLVYEVNGQTFTITDGTQVTLDAADGSNDRIDLIYGDDTGSLGKSTGTPAATPTANTLPSYQLQLKLALVPASATTPDGVSIRTVYTENAGQIGEFDATENTSAARIDLDNTTTPINGTYDIKTISSLNDGDQITLTHATATTLANFDYIKFSIKCLTDWSNDQLNVILLDSSTQVGSVVANVDTSNTSTVQEITIFKNDFTLVNGQTEFDVIKFDARVRGSSSLQFQLDEIYIGEDSRSEQPVNLTGLDISLDTTNFDNNLDNTITDVQKLADAVDELVASSSPLTTKGDILTYTTTDVRLGVGTNGQVLTADSAEASGLKWSTPAGGGDMLAATYDPNTVNGDAFDMDNMVEGSATKIMTDVERTKLSGIEANADVTDATNVDAAGATMNTDTDVSGNGWVLDEDTMSSDSNTKVPTQQSVKAYVDTEISEQAEVIGIACSDETTDLSVGTGVAEFQMPFAMTLTDVIGTVTTAPTGSTIIVDINDGGTTIMTTNKISIDATEKTSETAATPPTLTDTALAKDAVITIDIDQIGSTVAGAGLKVWLIGTRT